MTKKQQSGWLRPQRSPKGEVGWPLVGVLAATAFLWRPVLELFWYRDDYPTLYWLLHPEGPVNPVDMGDYKLAIYHGLLEVHWPFVTLFGTDVAAHRAGQLVLLLLVVGLFYWLAQRLSRSHLVATLGSLLLATTPVAFVLADRVSTAYQGYLSIACVIGVLLLIARSSLRLRSGQAYTPPLSLPKSPSSKSEHFASVPGGVVPERARRRHDWWLITAGVLFLVALWLTGVRLHAAFLGVGAVALWLGWRAKRDLKPVWIFIGISALATLVMVVLGGLGRNEITLAPTFLQDLVSSIGHLFVPSNGLQHLFAPLADHPQAIVDRYQLCVGVIGILATLLLASLPTKPRWSGWIVAGVSVLVSILFFLADPDVSQGDRTLQAREWLGLLAGIEVLLIAVGLAFSWSAKWNYQLALIGLLWAIIGFLPPFLVQPGAPFGTPDRYFVGSILGLMLFWVALLSAWLERRAWVGLAVVIGLIGWQTTLINSSLQYELTNHAQPARSIYTTLEARPDIFTPPSRLVFLAKPSSQAAFHLHEAFAASTIPDEAIFSVLLGAPYDTRRINISTLEEAAAEVQTGLIEPTHVFVFGYGVEDGLIDLSINVRPLLSGIETDTQAELIRDQLLTTVE